MAMDKKNIRDMKLVLKLASEMGYGFRSDSRGVRLGGPQKSSSLWHKEYDTDVAVLSMSNNKPESENGYNFGHLQDCEKHTRVGRRYANLTKSLTVTRTLNAIAFDFRVDLRVQT
jgi:hypothetical protein